MKKLSDERLEHFNIDNVQKYVGWKTINAMISSHFPNGDFSFLDVGGGNGAFADHILATFPLARGTVVENAGYQLDQNQSHARKTLVESSVADLDAHFQDEKFDLIFFHWVLHHFVENTYTGSIHTISNALKSAKQLLVPKGIISILENAYQPYFIESLPSRIIFHTLSSRVLSSVMHVLGANSAGTGVCYLSEKLWRRMLEDAGLTIEKCERTSSLKISRLKKLSSLAREINVVHIIARR